MSKTKRLTPKESVSQGVGRFVMDFRKWIMPETALLQKWKEQPIAYAVAEGRLVNDFQSMLDSYRKSGEASLPMLLFAVQQIASPPDLSQVVGVPWEIKTILPEDPLKRHVTLRTEPRTYHVQFVFLANDPDSANSFTSQFCSYIRLIEKRRFTVDYHVADDVVLKWHITIFDNSLYPDKADLEEINLTAGLLEFDFSGLVPQITNGLGVGSDRPWDVVVEADMYKDRETETFVRVNADIDTGKRTETIIEK